MDMNRVIKLSDLKPHQHGRVITIQTKTHDEMSRLMVAGVLPNACINLIQNDRRNVLFFANNDELTVDREIASRIYVELDK